MATTYGTKMYTRRPAKGDVDWDVDINDNWIAFENALCEFRTYYVSQDFTDANLKNASASDRRYFSKIQDAIDHAEGMGYAATSSYAIKVGPGLYNEHLVVSSPSVAIIGAHPCGTGYPPIYATKLNGEAATRGSILTINPTDGNYTRVLLANCQLNNAFNQSDAVKSGAYAVNATKPPTPTYAGSSSTFQMIDCSAEMQTWGAGPNAWDYGFHFVGHWTIDIIRSVIKSRTYGGGTNEGYIEKLFMIEGDVSASKTSIARFIDCILHTPEPTTPVGVYTFAGNNNCAIHAHRTTCGQASGSALSLGGTGTNTTKGLTGAEIATQFNLFGHDWTGWSD